MKKKFLLKGLLVSFMLLCAAQTWAYDFEVDNIQYTITSFDDMTVEVSGLTDTNVMAVFIPETVEYMDRTLIVKSIGKAFQSNKTLMSVSISNTVISIGAYAFDGCSELREVIIGEGVASIGSYAFRNCTSLLTIKIPDFVTSINTYTFYGCSSLTDVTIPSSVTSIGNYAFYECSSLTEVTIGDSVTSIGECAFSSCSSLKEIEIPNSVTSIGNRAFQNCSGLIKATINSLQISEYMFYNCSLLDEVTIGNSVTSMGSYAFEYCSSLTRVAIGNSVTNITQYAFYGCESLKEVTIPSSVTSVGNYAFYECTSLAEITIPNSVTRIGDYAFYGCSSLKELDIPDSMTKLGTRAFVGCNNLESLSAGGGLTELLEYCRGRIMYSGNDTRLYYYPFLWTDGPTQMKNIILRDDTSSFTTRGYYYYYYNYNYPYDKSPSKIEEGPYPIFSNIDVKYFYVGRPLTDTKDWKWSVEYNGTGYRLREVTISVSRPYGTIRTLEIGGYCTDVPYFYQSIEKLILGENVTTYTAENIYQGNLECIMCKSVIPPTLSGTFSNSTYLNVILYVPIGSKGTYQAAEGWRNFWNIIEMEVDDMTPVEKVASEKEGPTISAHDGSIIVKDANGAMINVYNLSGQVVYTGYDTIIPITNYGIYFVKVNGTTKKVLVQ